MRIPQRGGIFQAKGPTRASTRAVLLGWALCPSSEKWLDPPIAKEACGQAEVGLDQFTFLENNVGSQIYITIDLTNLTL